MEAGDGARTAVGSFLAPLADSLAEIGAPGWTDSRRRRVDRAAELWVRAAKCVGRPGDGTLEDSAGLGGERPRRQLPSINDLLWAASAVESRAFEFRLSTSTADSNPRDEVGGGVDGVGSTTRRRVQAVVPFLDLANHRAGSAGGNALQTLAGSGGSGRFETGGGGGVEAGAGAWPALFWSRPRPRPGNKDEVSGREETTGREQQGEDRQEEARTAHGTEDPPTSTSPAAAEVFISYGPTKPPLQTLEQYGFSEEGTAGSTLDVALWAPGGVAAAVAAGGAPRGAIGRALGGSNRGAGRSAGAGAAGGEAARRIQAALGCDQAAAVALVGRAAASLVGGMGWTSLRAHRAARAEDVALADRRVVAALREASVELAAEARARGRRLLAVAEGEERESLGSPPFQSSVDTDAAEAATAARAAETAVAIRALSGDLTPEAAAAARFAAGEVRLGAATALAANAAADALARDAAGADCAAAASARLRHSLEDMSVGEGEGGGGE